MTFGTIQVVVMVAEGVGVVATAAGAVAEAEPVKLAGNVTPAAAQPDATACSSA
jgi:hypothetical protein